MPFGAGGVRPGLLLFPNYRSGAISVTRTESGIRIAVGVRPYVPRTRPAVRCTQRCAEPARGHCPAVAACTAPPCPSFVRRRRGRPVWIRGVHHNPSDPVDHDGDDAAGPSGCGRHPDAGKGPRFRRDVVRPTGFVPVDPQPSHLLSIVEGNRRSICSTDGGVPATATCDIPGGVAALGARVSDGREPDGSDRVTRQACPTTMEMQAISPAGASVRGTCEARGT